MHILPAAKTRALLEFAQSFNLQHPRSANAPLPAKIAANNFKIFAQKFDCHIRRSH
jgi:hypothetical protein